MTGMYVIGEGSGWPNSVDPSLLVSLTSDPEEKTIFKGTVFDGK